MNEPSKMIASDTPNSKIGHRSSKAEIARIWAMMMDMFGARWDRMYGKTPNRTWEASLSKLTIMQMKRGIKAAMELELQHPPSLPYFIGLCKHGSDNVVRPMIEEQKDAPVPRTLGMKKVQEHLKNMRELVSDEPA